MKTEQQSTYPGPIDDFRGSVLSLAPNNEWIASDGTRLSVVERTVTRDSPLLHPLGMPLSEAANYRDPARARFMVTAGEASAVIDAFGIGNQTRVIFRDGYAPPFERPAMGKPFEEFRQVVIQGADKLLLAEQPSQPKRKHMITVTDEEIIKAKSQIEMKGLRPTADLIAARVTRNPDTDLPYHRVTLSKRLGEMRDDGIDV